MRRAIGISRRLGLLASLAAAAILATVAMTLKLSYEDASQAAARTSENVLNFVTLEVSNSVQALNTALEDVRDALRGPPGYALPLREVERLMIGRADRNPQIAVLAVADAGGKVYLTSSSDFPDDTDVSGEAFFTAQSSNADQGLYIGQPRDHARSGAVLPMSLRRNHPDGSFAGVVFGLLRLTPINTLMDIAQLGEDGKVSVMRADGTLLARSRMFGAPVNVVEQASQPDRLLPLMAEASGTIDAVGPIDGVQRRYVYATVPNLPLIVAVSLTQDQIYGEWQRRTLGLAAVTALSCIAIITLTVMFRRELLHRARVEAQLAQLVTVDSLTGIANRRRFDERLAQEWRRSGRTAKPIGLIMIDVDNFKAFNDRHGHWLGDDLLIHVAQTISRVLRRPGDMVARYGGEEFAVILPETESFGAAMIAERIREAIAQTGVEDATGRIVSTTASLGTCSLMPRQGQSESELIRVADAALYRAKKGGRDRVVQSSDDMAALLHVPEAS
ncbi:diguanylate cyclase domain-containing protein [Xanthobacteraceae bacterium A53D]